MDISIQPMDAIIKQVEELNRRALELNKEREEALWHKKRAEEELSAALKSYNETYGTNLTPDDVVLEYTKVYKDIEAQVVQVQKDIDAIENGTSIDSNDSAMTNGVLSGDPVSMGVSSGVIDTSKSQTSFPQAPQQVSGTSSVPKTKGLGGITSSFGINQMNDKSDTDEIPTTSSNQSIDSKSVPETQNSDIEDDWASRYMKEHNIMASGAIPPVSPANNNVPQSPSQSSQSSPSFDFSKYYT